MCVCVCVCVYVYYTYVALINGDNIYNNTGRVLTSEMFVDKTSHIVLMVTSYVIYLHVKLHN